MRYFEELADSLQKIDPKPIFQAIAALENARSRGNSVFLVGNGGSAATASHAANDLMKIGGLKAISIPDMTPTSLAYGNDDGWEAMFSSILIDLFAPNDVLIAISCSGESENVLEAAEFAGLHGWVLALTGNNERNSLGKMASITIRAPHDDIRVQEDIHLAVFHHLAGELRKTRS